MSSVDDRLKYYDERYSPIVQVAIPVGSSKRIIGDRSNLKCRFCGLSHPQVTFKKDAHVFPTFIGNRSLVSVGECDSCNKLVSELLEDHLDKFLGAYKTVSAIKSRNGVPTYKFGDFRMSVVGNEIRIDATESGNLMETNETEKTLTIKAVRGPHIKQQVYKCFVKMALSIVPLDELVKFQKTIEWVFDKDLQNKFVRPLNLHQTFIPGFAPQNGVFALLLKRREGIEDAPYMYFVIGFGNWVFQIMIPCFPEDLALAGKSMDFIYFPTPFEISWALGNVQRKYYEMSSTEVTRNERHDMQFRYGSMEENNRGATI